MTPRVSACFYKFESIPSSAISYVFKWNSHRLFQLITNKVTMQKHTHLTKPEKYYI